MELITTVFSEFLAIEHRRLQSMFEGKFTTAHFEQKNFLNGLLTPKILIYPAKFPHDLF